MPLPFFFILFLFGFILPSGSCQVQEPCPIPYHLDSPDQVLELPDVLTEISGIAFTPDFSELVAVQDEVGILFFLDSKTGEIKRQLDFWKSGDYEDLEFTDDGVLWVLKSNSKLYELKGWKSGEELQVNKHDGELDGEYDVEGLVWDDESGTLLLACKAIPAAALRKDDPQRVVFAFAPVEEKCREQPVAEIRKSNLMQWIEENGMGENFEKYLEKTDSDEFLFGPSAIAKHPHTGHWYVSSARGNLLVVFDNQWEICQVEKLPGKVHTQPEGLAFDAEGNLYISNEGNEKKRGQILRFNIR